jgi:hypothetical protein
VAIHSVTACRLNGIAKAQIPNENHGYGFYYDLDLFSDFTYYLDDPIKGDQFEQQDKRWVAGLDVRHTIFSQWFGRKVENTFGLQVRNDWVHNGLYRTENRVRTDKNDVNACNDEPIDACNTNPNLVAVLPADTDVNKFTDTMVGFYVENKIQWAEKFRTVAGPARRRRKICRHQLDSQLYRQRITWRSGGQLCGRQFRHGHQVPAQPQRRV